MVKNRKSTLNPQHLTISHEDATKVNIGLREKAGRLELKVSDNGKGITEKQISDTKSFGILGIRERVHLWRGKFKIHGVRDKGTTVIVNIPLPTQEKVND